MSQIKKNYIYNLLHRFFNIFFSLFSVPYLSRVLGAKNIGIFSYTNSIVAFFMLFCLLGISRYGNRLIAEVRDDRKERSKQFFSVYILQAICSITVSIFYLLYIIFFCKENQILFFIQFIYLISTLFDVSWFFFGIEKFKGPSVIGVLDKIVCVVFILLFVKNTSDLNNYAYIYSICTFLKSFLLFFFLKKEICFVKIKWKDIFMHFKPCVILFLPILAISIYKVVNKIILGTFAGDLELAYYTQVDKIVYIPLCFITELSVVAFPKMSNLLSKGNDEVVKKYMERALNFAMFLAFPISIGLIVISNDFVVLLLGEEFLKAGFLMKGLAVSILFIICASIIQNYYLICKKLDKEYAASTCFGAIVNVVLNLILIPIIDSVGAVIATMVTEFVVTLWQIMVIRKFVSMKSYLKNLFPYFVKALVMGAIVLLINLFPIKYLLVKVVLQVVVGMVVYCSLNLKMIKMLFQLMKIR